MSDPAKLKHNMLNVALLRGEMPLDVEILVCSADLITGPVVHFKYKGKVYMRVRGIMSAREYREKVIGYYENADWSARPQTCVRCGVEFYDI